MVFGRHQGHEIFFDNLLMLPQGRLHIRIDDPLLHQILLNGVVNHLGVILGAHAPQGFLLCLGDAQAVKGILDILRHLLPVPGHLGIRLHVSDNLVHVQLGNIRPPGGQGQTVIHSQGFQAELQHPLRVVLPLGNIPDNLLRKA